MDPSKSVPKPATMPATPTKPMTKDDYVRIMEKIEKEDADIYKNMPNFVFK
jgi:hypothetical protein